MILQNDDNLILTVKKLGCLFLSLARIAELESEKSLTPLMINEGWIYCKSTYYISKENLIKQPDEIIKYFIKYLECEDKKIYQVGVHDKGRNIFWGWVKNEWKSYKYMIEKVITPGPEGTHFRLCNNKKEVIYDPYAFKKYNHKQIDYYTLYSRIK